MKHGTNTFIKKAKTDTKSRGFVHTLACGRMKGRGQKMAAITPTLCWDCAKAVNRCSWSIDFTPVEGWTAEKTKLRNKDNGYVESYRVTACPEFEPDAKKGGK